jgi:hypothetical protein
MPVSFNHRAPSGGTETYGTAKLSFDDWRRCLWIGDYGKERRRRWKARRGMMERKGMMSNNIESHTSHTKEDVASLQFLSSLSLEEKYDANSEILAEYELHILRDEHFLSYDDRGVLTGEPNYYVMSRHMQNIFVTRIS